MTRKRESRPGLAGTRIYVYRGWLQYFAPDPIIDRKTGKVKRLHRLCPVGPGDELKARNLLDELLNRALPGSGDFPAAFKQWRQEFFTERAAMAPKNPEKLKLWLDGNKSLESVFNVIAASFRDANVADIKPAHVKKFLKPWDGRRAAQAYRGHLTKFFTWAASEGYRESNPATAEVVRVKVPEKRDVLITPEQFNAVREAVMVDQKGRKIPSGQMVQCYLDLTYLLHQRTTDVRLLRWSDIDEENGRIHVEPTKTSGSSGVAMFLPMSPAIRDALARAKNVSRMGSVFVIHTGKGQVYTASGMRSAFNRACDRAGVTGITMKDIRSMAATAARKAGFTKKQIMVGLGHKKESTTDSYFHDDEILTSELILDLPKAAKK